MLIGIDVDDVLANFCSFLITYHNRKYGTNFVESDHIHYEFWKIWGGTEEEALKKIYDFYDSKEFDSIFPVHGSQDGIACLREDHDLVVITSRHELVEGKTINWLNNYFPEKFSEIYFANEWSNHLQRGGRKYEICEKLGVELMVEDCLKYAMDCADHGIKTFLLDCPWNQVDSLPQLITRAYGWPDLISKINKDPTTSLIYEH